MPLQICPVPVTPQSDFHPGRPSLPIGELHNIPFGSHLAGFGVRKEPQKLLSTCHIFASGLIDQ